MEFWFWFPILFQVGARKVVEVKVRLAWWKRRTLSLVKLVKIVLHTTGKRGSERARFSTKCKELWNFSEEKLLDVSYCIKYFRLPFFTHAHLPFTQQKTPEIPIQKLRSFSRMSQHPHLGLFLVRWKLEKKFSHSWKKIFLFIPTLLYSPNPCFLVVTCKNNNNFNFNLK